LTTPVTAAYGGSFVLIILRPAQMSHSLTCKLPKGAECESLIQGLIERTDSVIDVVARELPKGFCARGCRTPIGKSVQLGAAFERNAAKVIVGSWSVCAPVRHGQWP
jgi:hypothetical protein